MFTEGGWAKVGDFFYLRLRSKELQGHQPALTMIVWNVAVAK